MALQFCCSYNCNMSCKGKGKKFHLFFVKVIIIISELELLCDFPRSSDFLAHHFRVQSFEVKKVKAFHLFFHKSIKAALLNQEETTCCFNATLRKYFSLLRLLCIVIMCKNIIRIFKRGWMERSTLQRYPFIESRSMASLSKCNALLMPYLQPSILD